MKLTLLFAVFLVVVAISQAAPVTDNIVVEDAEWEGFKTKFNKNYANEAEESERRELYKSTKKIVAEHNAKFEKGEVTYKLGINHFADLKQEERQKYHGVRIPNVGKSKDKAQ